MNKLFPLACFVFVSKVACTISVSNEDIYEKNLLHGERKGYAGEGMLDVINYDHGKAMVRPINIIRVVRKLLLQRYASVERKHTITGEK